MIGCLPTQALAFLAVFVYATHATQAIAFEWKPGFTHSAVRLPVRLRSPTVLRLLKRLTDVITKPDDIINYDAMKP